LKTNNLFLTGRFPFLRKKVIVTIEEEPDAGVKYENKWREIGEAILNCNEELSGNPQPVQFRTIAEMGAL